MTNYSLIYKAVDLVIEWQEATYYTSMNKELCFAYVMHWYNNTDIADAKMLATCVLHYGDYRPVNFNHVVIMTEDYFGGKENA